MSLELSKLKPRIRRKNRKRVGRGGGSGSGTYSGRGIKGQKSRSGGRIRPGFEGGRMPLIRQMPKMRGFRSIHPKTQVVTLGEIEKKFQIHETVSPKSLYNKGIIQNPRILVKVLSNGKIKKKFNFENVQFSASAKRAIEAVGGTLQK